jgi:hypothetical protein
MNGYIASWKFGRDFIIRCPGDVDEFSFLLSDVSDNELASFLRQSDPFRDSGPCDGNVEVEFMSGGGRAVDITRLRPQIRMQALTAPAPQLQAMRAVNRMPMSASLQLDEQSPMAGQVSAGLEIHHPKGTKRLNSVLHFKLNKPKHARVVLTVHHGDTTKTLAFPFGKSVHGTQKLQLPLAPQEGMAGVHHISVHGFAQRKNSNTKVLLHLKHIEVSSPSSRRI